MPRGCGANKPLSLVAWVAEVKAQQIWFGVRLSCQSADGHFLVPLWGGAHGEYVSTCLCLWVYLLNWEGFILMTSSLAADPLQLPSYGEKGSSMLMRRTGFHHPLLSWLLLYWYLTAGFEQESYTASLLVVSYNYSVQSYSVCSISRRMELFRIPIIFLTKVRSHHPPLFHKPTLPSLVTVFSGYVAVLQKVSCSTRSALNSLWS